MRGLQAGPLAKGLPMSLRRAVHRKAVPGDLEADLLRLAAAIEPLVPKVGARYSVVLGLGSESLKAWELQQRGNMPCMNSGRGCQSHWSTPPLHLMSLLHCRELQVTERVCTWR